MIEFIHRHPIIIKILLTVTTVAFVGTGGYFLGRENVRYAAKVDDQLISLQQYQNAAANMEEFYRKIYQGNVPEDLFKKLNIPKMALNQLIDRKVIMIAAERMGIDVSDREVADEVRNNKSFMDKDGQFSKTVYNEVLKLNNMTPKDYENTVRENLIVERFRKLVGDSVVVTDDDLRRYFKELRESQGLAFDEKAFKDKKEQLNETLKNINRGKVMEAVVQNLRSEMQAKGLIEISPDVQTSG
jgi:peptidyl-prolyl cis-trans isomerase D